MFDDKMSVSEAESIINQRPGDGFEKIEDFKENSSVAGLLAADAALSSSFVVDSKYFRLEAGAKVDTATFRLESIIKTDGSEFRDINPTVWWTEIAYCWLYTF